MRSDDVERARDGDHAAWASLAGATVDRLYAAARLIVGDPDRAEDAVQETLVRAWRYLPTLRDADRFEPWLHRLLVRACTDEARRHWSWRGRVAILHVEQPVTTRPEPSPTATSWNGALPASRATTGRSSSSTTRWA